MLKKTFLFGIVLISKLKKDIKMTMIVHGLTALTKYIATKRINSLEKDLNSNTITEQEAKSIIERIDKAENVRRAANRFMSKLKRAEEKIDFLDNRATPFALEKSIGVGLLGLIVAPYYAVEQGIESAKKAKQQKEKAKQETEKQNALKAAKEAIENKEKQEESKENSAISLMERIVSGADLLDVRRADIKQQSDKNAIVAGMIDEYGKIAKILSDKGEIVMFINRGFDQEENKTKANAFRMFFVNPETGNYEELARVKSKRGMRRVANAWDKRKEVLLAKQKDYEVAKQMNARLVQATATRE